MISSRRRVTSRPQKHGVAASASARTTYVMCLKVTFLSDGDVDWAQGHGWEAPAAWGGHAVCSSRRRDRTISELSANDSGRTTATHLRVSYLRGRGPWVPGS